jgi:hypothetical protein
MPSFIGNSCKRLKKKYPNLFVFVPALRKEADRVVQWMNDVAKGYKIPQDYSDHVFPDIRLEFYNENKRPSAKESPRKGCSKRGGK